MRTAFIAVLLCASALAACGDKEPNVIVQEAPVDANAGEPAVNAPMDQAAAPAAVDAAVPAAGTAPAPGSVPMRKPGLWQISSTRDGQTTTGTLCVSEATEAGRRSGVFATMGGGFGGRGGPGGPGGQRPGGGDGPRGERPGGGEGRGPGAGGPGGGGGEGRGFGGGGGFGGGAACQPKISQTADGWQSVTSCSVERDEFTMKTSGKMTLTGDLSTKYTVKGSTTISGSPREQMNGTRQVSITGTYKGACPAGMKPGDFKGADGETRNLLQGPRRG